MNSQTEILKAASKITVINDGQFRYPVLTESMAAWVGSNGKITASNYDQFCACVECIGEKIVGTTGSQGMIDLCDALVETGADSVTLS